MKRSFLNTLNYTSSNEDSRSELKALQIRKDDSVLCITGSGGRTLDLLVENPTVIISIDFDPCQSFLMELKLAALKQLDYQDFLEFLGIQYSEEREQVYQVIRNSLSNGAKNYWDNQISIIKKGVIYQGRWEKYFRLLAAIVNFVRPKLASRLFNSEDTKEQYKIWWEEWDNLLWRLFLRCISSRTVWKYCLGDPGFYKYVPKSFSIYKYLSDKFNLVFENIAVKQSPFANLLFFGSYKSEDTLPFYLQKKNFYKMKKAKTRIQIITVSLEEYLYNCKTKRFDKYSLSDFSSYTSIKAYLDIWKGIIETASPGACICERQYLVKREPPMEVQPYISRDINLEKKLEFFDDSIFYTFVIAKVEGKK